LWYYEVANMRQTPPSENGVDQGEDQISTATLFEKLDGTPQADEPGGVVSDIVTEVEASLVDSEQFSYERAHVLSSLDEVLVSLVALQNGAPHGKQLCETLAEDLDMTFSPGTVYPRLDDLCEEEILKRHDLVNTIEYTFDDTEKARSNVAAAARQHLALELLFRTILEQGDFE
jgi:DNA-binding PadR family transcriptional regulator